MLWWITHATLYMENHRIKGLLKANRDRHGDEILGELKKSAAAAEETDSGPVPMDEVASSQRDNIFLIPAALSVSVSMRCIFFFYYLLALWFSLLTFCMLGK